MKRIISVLVLVVVLTACNKDKSPVGGLNELMSCDFAIHSDERNTIEELNKVDMTITTSIVNGENKLALIDANEQVYLIGDKLEQKVLINEQELNGDTFELGTVVTVDADVKEICSETLVADDNSEVRVLNLKAISEKECVIEHEIQGGDVNMINKFMLVGIIHEDNTISYPPCNANSISIKFLDVKVDKEYFLFEGTGPINSYGGGYKVEEDAIEFNSLNATHIGGAPKLVSYENMFFSTLLNAKAIEIEKNALYIPMQGSSDRLLFVRM